LLCLTGLADSSFCRLVVLNDGWFPAQIHQFLIHGILDFSITSNDENGDFKKSFIKQSLNVYEPIQPYSFLIALRFLLKFV
jgi:hypothetical protein